MSFVEIEKDYFIRNGERIHFRGFNLGNWMLVEHYMMGLPWTEYKMRAMMRSELGEERFRAFWDTFMDESLTEKDFAFMEDEGFNWVQLPMNYRHFQSDGTTSGFDGRGFEYVDRVLEWGRAYDMPVLLSLHAAPGVQVRDWNAESAFGEAFLFDHEYFLQQTEAFWLTVAARYADDPIVMGLEIMNEPVVDDLAFLHDFNRRMLAAIRSVDTNHIVAVGFNRWNKDFDSLDPSIFDDQLVVGVFHHYLTQTHPFGTMTEYPGEFEGRHYGPDELLAHLVNGIDSFPVERPLLCGEFGVPRAGSPRWAGRIPDAQLAMFDDLVGFLEERNVSWSAWDYKDLGVLGLVRPADDTPWARFQARDEIQRITTDAYGEAIDAYVREIEGSIGKLTSAELNVVRTQTKHVYDGVMLPRVVEELSGLSADELAAMARSYAFEHCIPVDERLAVYRKHLNGGAST